MNNYNIHLLVYKNNYNKIKKLLENDKKNIYIRNEYFELPIHIACKLGLEKMFSY